MNRSLGFIQHAAPVRFAARTLRALAFSGSPTRRRALTVAGLAGAYFVAAKLGLQFAYVHPSATVIWPPSGITLAAFLVLGLDLWPAILIGAFLANLTTYGSIATSLCIGTGNTLEGLLGAALVARFAGGRDFLLHPRDIVKFALLAGMLSTTVSATVGVTSLALAGFAPWSGYGHIWLTWWLGDLAGDLVVAPLLIVWSTAPRMRWDARVILEALTLLTALSLVTLMVFDGLIPATQVERLPLQFLCSPLLLWAAFRLGRRGVATSILVLASIAIIGTLHGLGPFARRGPNESLLLLQAFLAVEAVTMLAVAAVIGELRRAEDHAQQLAVKDELTGLANYRAFMTSLDGEIRRTHRLSREFAVLVLDVDGLKQLNDRLGHLAGNRALCRIGECLRVSCRATDTAARFGGDEFAIILPETAEAGARQLTERIREHLARDAERPAISVSIGVAVYPRDGTSPEKLLGAADQELYRGKAAHAGRGSRI
jgi:diguanylate cyclase (GGDEF)-like protein